SDSSGERTGGRSAPCADGIDAGSGRLAGMSRHEYLHWAVRGADAVPHHLVRCTEGEYGICRGSARPGRPRRAGRPEGVTRRRDLSLGATVAPEVAAVGCCQAAAVLRELHAPLVLPRLALALVLGGYDDLPVALDLDTPHGPGALVEADLARADPKAGIAPAGAAGG